MYILYCIVFGLVTGWLTGGLLTGNGYGPIKGVKRILAKLKTPDFNCLEITEVVSKRFLGLPCTSVRARSRHIQESVFLFRSRGVSESKRTSLVAV